MKKSLLTVLLAFLLVFSGAMFAACGEKDPVTPDAQVVDVKVMKQPTKTTYLKDEPFDITGGEIAVIYDDANIVTIAMTAEMYTSADTSKVGNYELTVTVTVEGTEYTFKIPYTVAYSQATLDYIVLVEGLPMLNAATLDDVDAVLSAIDAYEKLTAEEKAYIDSDQKAALTKVERLSERLAPEYLEAERSAAKEWRELLNANNYTEENLAAIEDLIAAFLQENETELKEAVAVRDKLYEDLGKVAKRTDDPTYSLAEHKENSIKSLQDLLKASTYKVVDEGLTESSVIKETVDYAQDSRFSAQVAEVIAKVNAATTIEETDTAYSEAVRTLRGIYIKEFAAVAKTNLTALITDWRDTMEDQLARWEEDTIGLANQYADIITDYLGGDNRWYTPMPYRLNVLLNGVESKLATATSILELNEYYETFAYEILRATMQKNLEMYYAIERNLSPKYNPDDSLYWGYVSNIWGASSEQSFTYEGILSEYVGQRFGTDNGNPYRWSNLYSNVPKCYANVVAVGDDIDSLVEVYNGLLDKIFYVPATLSEVTIESMPSKTVYLEEDTFTLEGGKLRLTYSDGSFKLVDMTDASVTYTKPVDMSGGEHTVQITYTDENGSTHQFDIHYTVNTNADLGELIELVNELPEADKATAADLAKAIEAAEIYNGLHADLQAQFDEMEVVSAKFIAVQHALATPYADSLGLWSDYEILNIGDYSEENAAAIEEKHAKLVTDVAAAATFAAVDELMATYEEELGAVATAATDLAAFVANSVKTAEKIAEVQLHVIQTTNYTTWAPVGPASLKEEAAVSAAIEAMGTALNAGDLAAAKTAYKTEIAKVHAAVLEAFRTKALENVKAVPDDMYDGVKALWEEKGFDEHSPEQLEAWNSYSTMRYTEGEYTSMAWATPECFQVSVVYAKIDVKAAATKHALAENYEASYYEMIRVVAFRQLDLIRKFLIDQYKVTINEWGSGGIYSHTAGAGSDAQLYDGILDDYRGKYYGLSQVQKDGGMDGLVGDYRLWGSAIGPNKKTTVDTVLADYNWMFVNTDNPNNWLTLAGIAPNA